MIVNFTKMQGLGNDFVIIDLITQGLKLYPTNIIKIADRKFGIGCDQVILVQSPQQPDADFFYRIYNPDGTEVEQCGNGLRCAVKFFIDTGLTNKNLVVAECMSARATASILENKHVSVNLGNNYSEVTEQSVTVDGHTYKLYAISVGNPHAVCIVDDLERIAINDLGHQLSTNTIFPQGANIGFMQVLDKRNVRLRVYERGAGATLACGSGACAAMLVGAHLQLLERNVNVQFAHGALDISLNQAHELCMSGNATTVFIGKFRL